tara:strand:+ start:188 stop:415 length:228 start_codon:yes stop_codon:yes gene_type:complete
VKVGDLIRDKETRDVGLIIDISYDHEEAFGGTTHSGIPLVYPYRVTALDNGYTAWLEKDYIERGCEVISCAEEKS